MVTSLRQDQELLYQSTALEGLANMINEKMENKQSESTADLSLRTVRALKKQKRTARRTTLNFKLLVEISLEFIM